MPFCPHCGTTNQAEDAYCRSCGNPLRATSVPEPVTVPERVTVATERPVVSSWIQKIGQEGLLALVGFALIAVSVFLPWAEFSSLFGQLHMTGLQVAGGVPGTTLLAVVAIGGVATLFSRSLGGFMSLVGGTIVLAVTSAETTRLRSFRIPEVAASYAWSSLGSGSYLATVSGFLVVLAGVIFVVRSLSTRSVRPAKQTSASPISTVIEKPPIPRSARVSEFDVWIPILWLVVILFCGSLSNPRIPGWVGGFTMLSLATIWVYYDSKKRDMKSEFWIATLLLAVIGLPWYAYRLHKLRETQQ